MKKSAILYFFKIFTTFVLLVLMKISIIQPAISEEISGKLLDIGHTNGISLLRNSGNRLLSRDSSGLWILWNVNNRKQIMNGNSSYKDQFNQTKMDYIELSGNTLAVSTGDKVQLISVTDGTLLTNISINSRSNSVGLSIDGTYLWAATDSGLHVWLLSGSKLLSASGNYANARIFADAVSIKVANGAYDSNVIETIPLDGGDPSISPSFFGNFHSWFLDGSHFLTTIGTVAYVYSPSVEQKALVDLGTTESLGGSGSYFWTHQRSYPNYPLKIYKVGSGSAPLEVIFTGVLHKVVPTLNKIGVLPSGYNDFDIIHLNTNGITKTSHEGPGAYLDAFGADADGSWSVGNSSGVIYDNLSSDLPFEDKAFGYGEIRSIAGSKSGTTAIATANGQILIFNINDTIKSLEKMIEYDSSHLKLTSNGEILAAQANSYAQYSPNTDIPLTIFSLPTDSIIREWEYSVTTGPHLFDFDLSLNGIIASRLEGRFSGNWSKKGLTNIIESGSLILSVDMDKGADIAPKLSPDGIGAAISDGYTMTKIYENGQLSAAINGRIAGWIDNERLLINTYYYSPKYLSYIFVASYIYNRNGYLVSELPLPEITSFTAINGTKIFSRKSVYDLQTGHSVWTAVNSSIADAVSNNYVVYAEGGGLYWYKWTADLLPAITLISPNGGESLRSGRSYNITWSAWGPGIHHIRLLYSTDGGNTYPYTIVASTDNDGNYEWKIPELDSQAVRVKTVAEDSNNIMLSEDTSDSNFTINSFILQTISDLTASPGAAGNTIILEWTAPENIITTDTYIIRYKTAQIIESNWDESSDIDGEPTPGSAGNRERITVKMQYPGINYYFAIRIKNEEQDVSDVSNSPCVMLARVYLYAGWNLMSFIPPTVMPIEEAISSILSKCVSVWRYDACESIWQKYIVEGPSFLNNLEEIGPGYGYWINVEEDCTWNYGGALAGSPLNSLMRKPPFVLYGKITEDDHTIAINEGHEVSLKLIGMKASSYVMGSNLLYEDYYVLEIPVDDLFREGDPARVYVDNIPSEGEFINLGGVGIVRQHNISYTRIPKVTKLFQNYPNPFNPETWIPYQLATDSEVTIRIYSSNGQLIRNMDLGFKKADLYVNRDAAAYWVGTTDAGEYVSSGIYFYTIKAGDYNATKKMIIVR